MKSGFYLTKSPFIPLFLRGDFFTISILKDILFARFELEGAVQSADGVPHPAFLDDAGDAYFRGAYHLDVDILLEKLIFPGLVPVARRAEPICFATFSVMAIAFWSWLREIVKVKSVILLILAF